MKLNRRLREKPADFSMEAREEITAEITACEQRMRELASGVRIRDIYGRRYIYVRRGSSEKSHPFSEEKLRTFQEEVYERRLLESQLYELRKDLSAAEKSAGFSVGRKECEDVWNEWTNIFCNESCAITSEKYRRFFDGKEGRLFQWIKDRADGLIKEIAALATAKKGSAFPEEYDVSKKRCGSKEYWYIRWKEAETGKWKNSRYFRLGEMKERLDRDSPILAALLRKKIEKERALTLIGELLLLKKTAAFRRGMVGK